MDQRLTDYLNTLNDIEDVDKAWKHVVDFFSNIGFDSIVYAYNSDASVLSLPVAVLTTASKDWFAQYAENNYISDDPLYYHCSTSLLPVRVQVDNRYKFDDFAPRSNEVMNEAHSAGLGNGVAVPIRISKPNGYAAMGVFSSMKNQEMDKLLKSDENLILLTSLYTHMHVESLLRSENNSPVVITPRQRELLLWLAKGLQNDQIADKMNISYAGVSYLLGELKQRLGVRTRREVLPKALQLRIIEP